MATIHSTKYRFVHTSELESTINSPAGKPKPPRQRAHKEVPDKDMAANNDDIRDDDHRVVLLLDLDCFYAQAMCIRLGYDAATTPLALFQWNSVLAVTYPARTQYGIKRGDSWDAVRSKSNGECLCVHVPILTTTTTTTANSNSNEEQEHLQDVDDNADFENSKTPGGSSTIEQEYRDYFLLNPDQQQAARRRELGVRRYSQDGKASIECFRIASARILSLVKTFLHEQYKNDKKDRVCILERASIDEFFLDVTTAASAVENNSKTDYDPGSSAVLLPKSTVIIGCEDDDNHNNSNNNVKTSSAATAVAGTERKSRGGGNDHDDDNDGEEEEEEEVMADIRLARGCRIADQIRTRVREELNFTLTAGISINKTIAKLAATYGKPNGQAVCFPRSIVTMLRATPIGKCRNLGGKLGALVEQVLRAETTGSPATTAVAAAPAPAMVGDIVRHLSLSRLLQCGHFSEPTARWIWHIAHGRDHEPVQAKDQTAVLTKSITAFKSLNFGYDDARDENNNNNNSNNKNGHLLGDTTPWIQLLAQEVVDRVTRDEQRNHRYPKSCVIQYTTSRNNITRSVRIPFPSHKWSNRQKQDHLVTMVPKTVATKEQDRNVRLRRIGICATDFFEQRPAGTSIERFFTEEACCSAAAAAAAAVKTTTTTTPSPLRPGSKLRENVVAAAAADSTTVVAKMNKVKDDDDAVDESSLTSSSDRDLALARSLQAKYDREEQSLRLLESRKRKQSAGCIDSFFPKRPAAASVAKK
jgi:nucleotidyltransferase/DNA polymerase involved in DNA repair